MSKNVVRMSFGLAVALCIAVVAAQAAEPAAPAEAVRSDGDLYESACHEGNDGMANIFSSARQQQRQAALKQTQ